MAIFEKIKKKFSLNNSYFKNRKPQDPKDPFEVLEYLKEHNELPYTEEVSESWFYDCFVEYQKRAGVQNSQFFTPTLTAEQIAYKTSMYAIETDKILEPCCGFGQITKALISQGFEDIKAFDNDPKMAETCEYFHGEHAKIFQADFADYKEDEIQYDVIVSNPPYEAKDLTEFLAFCIEKLKIDGVAILLIPAGFLYKSRPAKLVQTLNEFAIIDRQPMQEEFAQTKARAELVVLKIKSDDSNRI